MCVVYWFFCVCCVGVCVCWWFVSCVMLVGLICGLMCCCSDMGWYVWWLIWLCICSWLFLVVCLC